MRKIKNTYIAISAVISSVISWWLTFGPIADFTNYIHKKVFQDSSNGSIWSVLILINIIFISLFYYFFRFRTTKIQLISIIQIFIITFLIEINLLFSAGLCEGLSFLLFIIYPGVTRIFTIPLAIAISFIVVRKIEGNQLKLE